MGKYAINKEFGIYRNMHTPKMPPKMAGFVGSLMRAPRSVWHDERVFAERIRIKSYDGEWISLIMLTPKELGEAISPMLVYFHGGGFFFGAAAYHYELCIRYAVGAGCRVLMADYRLSPKYPFPTPTEDCLMSLLYARENAERLGTDPERIAIGGDSAGGCLAASVAAICRDRGLGVPRFALLVYPVTDRRMDSESNKRYTDTPMWNSRLSVGMWQGYLPPESRERHQSKLPYASPLEAESFEGLPPTYVETAEFDCLHDEGVLYAEALKNAGVEAELYETHGTMHGYDIAINAQTTKNSINRRIAFMKRFFE